MGDWLREKLLKSIRPGLEAMVRDLLLTNLRKELEAVMRDLLLKDLKPDLGTVLRSLNAQRNLALDFHGDFYTTADQKLTMGEYWSEHNVTGNLKFNSVEESLAHFELRNKQYPDYIEHMPVVGLDDKVILDF